MRKIKLHTAFLYAVDNEGYGCFPLKILASPDQNKLMDLCNQALSETKDDRELGIQQLNDIELDIPD